MTVIRTREWYLESCLENWARWMDAGGEPDGLPDKASGGVTNFTSYDDNNEKAYERLDRWLAETTNAVIDGLVPIEQAAICNHYLAAVWQFNRQAPDILSRAKANIIIRLEARGVWFGDEQKKVAKSA